MLQLTAFLLWEHITTLMTLRELYALIELNAILALLHFMIGFSHDSYS